MLVIAHRMPTSRAACAAMAEAGAGIFEVDVQVGRHGLVMSHYAPVPRFGQLHRDGWRFRWGQATALLDHQLTVLPTGTRILLDLKERTVDGRKKMIETIALFDDRARFVASGSHLDDFAILRKAGIETWRSIGNPQALQRVLTDKAVGADGVTVRHTLLDEKVIEQLHARTPIVIAWTVNSRDHAAHLREIGVDGITTDRPAVMRMLANR